jgi:CubicO group peptidase (beta-lactamase class C family)
MALSPGPFQFSAARDLLDHALAGGAFPAAVAEVGTSTHPVWRQAFGRLSRAPGALPAREDTLFDLASLTKVLSTTPLVTRLVERGALDFDDPIARHVPAWHDRGATPVTIRDLLSHSAGLPAYLPLFREHSGPAALERAICALPPAYVPRTTAIYSDLGFLLLGFLLERTAPLSVQFDALRQRIGGLEDLIFSPPAALRSRIAPTRRDDWRGRLLVGEVDDNNAWAVGGVAGNAGLFGTAGSVGVCARHLLQVLAGRSGAFRRDSLETVIGRRADVPGSSRALGWDTMVPTSSCGSLMSPRAFGHTGFTGTSLWIDPERGLYVVLLTNRVYPTPDNEALVRLRAPFHDAVVAGWDRDASSRR